MPKTDKPIAPPKPTGKWLAAVLLIIGMTQMAQAGAEANLGTLLYSDINLSVNRNQACATCHSLVAATNALTHQLFPTPGFVDPTNVTFGTAVSGGSVPGLFGTLNAPSVGYAAFSPDFQWESTNATAAMGGMPGMGGMGGPGSMDGMDISSGMFVGGQFWNGRAANLQAQAAFPLLGAAEMGMLSEWAVVTRLKENANYVTSFMQLYGIDLNAIQAYEMAPTNMPTPPDVDHAFKAATQAISVFERQPSFNQFTSKFDYWMCGVTTLTTTETNGYNLFRTKGGCVTCHPTDMPMGNNASSPPMMITTYTYQNLGLPRNWTIPGTPAPDLGLGGRPDIAMMDPMGTTIGTHKVMSLRNIAVTPPYGHNGVFSTLQQMVHFLNTRDVLGTINANTNAGFGVTGWPPPEVPQNVYTNQLGTNTIGNLQLTAEEETDIVAFLNTMTDNYPSFGGDPKVPPGTGTPYSAITIPGISSMLESMGPGHFALMGQLGQYYQVEFATNLAGTVHWQTLQKVLLSTNGIGFTDTNAPNNTARFYRVFPSP